MSAGQSIAFEGVCVRMKHENERYLADGTRAREREKRIFSSFFDRTLNKMWQHIVNEM